ncbi:MAG: efflux RND transporter periplasmic adaptor subunit [Phycisphaerales bacterium]|nr:efflux RND transporter periplasmic adaptor subunit [Phycisphaerales bacterium]MCB9864678.1 efflux RND transporter periplasmic adaptor subunit [Phycisphaerales bacterium]
MKFLKIAIVLLLIAGGVFGYNALNSGPARHEIEYSEVVSGPLTFAVETLGTLEPLSEVVVSCEATGKIVEILKDFDDPVEKNEIICRIDPELVDAQHAQSVAEKARAESAVQNAEIDRNKQLALLPVYVQRTAQELASASAALELAQYNFDRIAKLKASNNANDAEYVNAKAMLDQAKAAVETAKTAHQEAQFNEQFIPSQLTEAIAQAKAAKALAQAMFDTTKAQVEKCVIRSPIDGIVLTRYLDVGTTVNPTLQPPPLFLIAPSLERMKVSARVSESDIAHIEVGQKATFTVEGKHRTSFEGTILQKRNQPEIIQGVTTYTVILEVQNDARRTLLPGMSVNVVIECVRHDMTDKIANKALRFRPPLDLEARSKLLDEMKYPAEPKNPDGSRIDYCQKSSAWTYDESKGSWTPVPLWTGVTDNFETQILAGAKKGDKFVDKFIQISSGGFSLKEAIRQASPTQRSL